MSRKKISSTVYFEPEQHDALRALVARTKVPMAEWVRIGVEHVLANIDPDPFALLTRATQETKTP